VVDPRIEPKGWRSSTGNPERFFPIFFAKISRLGRRRGPPPIRHDPAENNTPFSIVTMAGLTPSGGVDKPFSDVADPTGGGRDRGHPVDYRRSRTFLTPEPVQKPNIEAP
jgi:hypothetical protein